MVTAKKSPFREKMMKLIQKIELLLIKKNFLFNFSYWPRYDGGLIEEQQKTKEERLNEERRF